MQNVDQQHHYLCKDLTIALNQTYISPFLSYLQAVYFVIYTLHNLILVNQESSVPSSNDDIFSSPSSRGDILGATSEDNISLISLMNSLFTLHNLDYS
jgi:hypothetical protein